MNRRLANFVGFQLVWCAAVAGAAAGHGWLGPAAVLLFAALHLAFAADRRSDLVLMLVCALLGVLVDSLWLTLGWLRFAGGNELLAPPWIVAMWLGFALTINHSLASLRPHRWLAAVLGALGGPAAYWIAAYSWHALELREPLAATLGLALAWGLLTPLLLQLGGRLQQSPPRGIVLGAH